MLLFEWVDSTDLSVILGELSRLGLVLDIAGSIFIAKSVFYRNNKDIFNTSDAFLGYSYSNTLNAIKAKREALLGSALLIFGFLFQFLGSRHTSTHVNLILDFMFFLTVLIFSVALNYAIKKLSVRTVDSLRNEYEKKKEMR